MSLFWDGALIKYDYDVDKVTQQIALTQPPQELTVSNESEKTRFIGLVGGLFVSLRRTPHKRYMHSFINEAKHTAHK